MRVRGLRVTVAVALTAALAACAAPPQSAATAPLQTAAATEGSGFDGTYSGQASPDQIVGGCGAATVGIEIKVKGARIWTHHSHPSLSGTIDATGNVSMQNDDGTSTLFGLIQGAVLTGTETSDKAPKKLQGFYVSAQSTCTFSVQAARGSGGDADGAP